MQELDLPAMLVPRRHGCRLSRTPIPTIFVRRHRFRHPAEVPCILPYQRTCCLDTQRKGVQGKYLADPVGAEEGQHEDCPEECTVVRDRNRRDVSSVDIPHEVLNTDESRRTPREAWDAARTRGGWRFYGYALCANVVTSSTMCLTRG